MRRTLFFALLLCLQWTAWGQVTYDFRYWFDADESNQRTGSMAAGSGHIDADLSGLDCSFHTIHIQVKDTAGVWSVPITRHFIKIPEKSTLSPYYWFNNDYAGRKSLPALSGVFDIDVSELSGALNTFHYQVSDTEGSASAPLTSYFLKVPATQSMTYRYWLDNDTSTMKRGEYTGETLMLDVSKIQDGIHVLHLQMEATGGASTPFTALFMKVPDMKNMTYRYWVDNDHTTMKSGRYVGEPLMVDVSDMEDGFHIIYFQVEGTGGASIPANRMFIKIPQTEDIGEMTCVCTIDGKLYKQEKVASSGGTVNWEFDVSKFSQGLHRIQVQVLTPSGAASNVHDGFFFRSIMQEDLQSMTLVYSIDGEAYQSQVGDFNTGMFHFDVDVASLNDGLHRLTYMLSSETGSTTKVNTSFFVKTPLGGPGIASYKYWLNDYEDEARFVKLAERKNPYELISLLPVDECPIRSTCFHFEVEEDGTPMVYAKNDIHLQFFDVSNRVAEAHKQYVDYNVGEAIEEITLLESGKRIYKAKPQDNKIHWFKVEAVKGDSLSLKTDQACTIQIFSPSGKEVYNQSGSGTVSYNGIHAQEDGTFYVALHDVTGTKGNTIALDFQHIDKYDVLRWDVSTVGNGGASTITYEGNGFKDLYAIDYVSTNGDTIKCEYIDHISDATISATMDFNGATLGTYKAIFHFTEGDRVVDNVVKVEEAKDIVLESKVSYPTQYLRNTTVAYTLSIENRGNMTAYKVPIYTFIRNYSLKGIKHIQYEGLKLPNLYDKIDKTLFSMPDLKELNQQSDNLGHDMYFNKVWLYDEEVKDSVVIRSNYFFIDIQPKSSVVLNLNITSDDRVDVWFTIPPQWPSFTDNISINNGSKSLSIAKDFYCCYIESLNCALDIFSIACDLVGPVMGVLTIQCPELAPELLAGSLSVGIMGCATSVSSDGIRTFTESICNPNGNMLENIKKGLFNGLRSSFSIDNVIGCISNTLFLYADLIPKDVIKNAIKAAANAISVKSIYADAKQLSSNNFSCKSMLRKKPGCPPIPPVGGTSNPVNSFDPNDVYGYRSESGSKAVKKDWTDVYYTIEFENDTAFATASAQDVYLTDTLDSRYFDLKSFAPTSLKIGDKKVELSGEPNFVTTVDMRPKINAIAQVECKYDEQRGIAKWHFTSLDPMTMEHVTMPMDGFLPVNNSEGDGQGEVSFNVRLKTGLADGEQIPNRASIVFDMNEPIITPTWVNVVDAIAPVSGVTETVMKNDTIMTIFFDGTDNYSGVWKYDLYVQAGVGTSWFKLAENLTDSLYDYRVYEGIDYGFCVIATDSAGNVEQKELIREGIVLDYLPGDANGDGRISVVDLTMVTNAILRKEDEGFNAKAADLNMDGQISITDATMITNLILKK